MKTKNSGNIDVFPNELTNLLTQKGEKKVKELIKNKPMDIVIGNGRVPLNTLYLNDVINTKSANRIIELLDFIIYPSLVDKSFETVKKLPQSYSEYTENKVAPYSCNLLGRDSDSDNDREFYELTKKFGLLKFANSKSLREFMSGITGHELRFGTGMPFSQILCYEEGGYIGMHCDWFANMGRTGNFLVFHLNLPNSNVKEQSLIYQKGNLLSGYESHAKPSIGIMRLPFWHMTTPLQAKNDNNMPARRWLISIAFQVFS